MEECLLLRFWRHCNEAQASLNKKTGLRKIEAAQRLCRDLRGSPGQELPEGLEDARPRDGHRGGGRGAGGIRTATEGKA